MKALAILSVIFLGLLGLGMLFQADQIADPIPENEANAILQATLRIEVEGPLEDGEIVVRYGLGSIVNQGGEIVIATNNHWGIPFIAQTNVKILTGDRHLLATLSGQQVMDTLRYQDAGTLIFAAPVQVIHQLLPVSEMLEAGQVALRQVPGTVVYAVHRLQDEQATVVMVPLVVESVTQDHGVTVIRLRSLEGEYIRRGDSGGGVWLNNVLVGNLWTTQKVEGDEAPQTRVSFAALFPLP